MPRVKPLRGEIIRFGDGGFKKKPAVSGLFQSEKTEFYAIVRYAGNVRNSS